jgi:hypothetical protein
VVEDAPTLAAAAACAASSLVCSSRRLVDGVSTSDIYNKPNRKKIEMSARQQNKRVETTSHYDNNQQPLTDDIRFCTESASMLFSSSPLGSLSSRARRNARDFKKPKRQLQNAISRGTPHQQRHAILFKNSLVLTGRCATTSSLGRRCYKCVR